MAKRRKPDPRPAAARVNAAPRLRAPHTLLSAVALFLLIAGARWWLIGNYATDVPWLDQWDAEAQGLFQPAHLDLHAWFAPHNEHRIFFTRALAFGLRSLNGQWDPRLEMVANASLYAAIAAGLFLLLRRNRTPGFQVFCWILLAVLGCAPYAATNVLLGFQSQFYFLAGFSLFAIYLLLNGRPIAGALCGAAALFSMGSGYAAALAAAAVLIASGARRHWRTLAIAAFLTAAGVLLRAAAANSADFAAKSAADFFRFLLACLSWPGSPMLLLAVLSWLPFAAFAALWLRREAPDGPTERFILGIGVWVLLQAAALALYRANSGEGLESRYTDVLAFGLLANALAAVWLAQSAARFRTWAQALAAVWFAVSAFGLYNASTNNAAMSWKHDMEIRRAATAGFLATGDRHYLDSAPPHPDVAHVAALLQDPAIHPILPAGIRPSVTLEPRNGSPAPAMVNGLSMPDFTNVPPGLWTFPGAFTRFAALPPSTPFEYRITTTGALPHLLLYTVGNRPALSQRLLPLPAEGWGDHAIISCPAPGCTLRGATGPSQFLLGEPKEIGALSIAAIFAALWGPIVAAAGAVLFVGLLAVPMARGSRRTDAVQPAEQHA